VSGVETHNHLKVISLKQHLILSNETQLEVNYNESFAYFISTATSLLQLIRVHRYSLSNAFIRSLRGVAELEILKSNLLLKAKSRRRHGSPEDQSMPTDWWITARNNVFSLIWRFLSTARPTRGNANGGAPRKSQRCNNANCHDTFRTSAYYRPRDKKKARDSLTGNRDEI